MHLGFHISTTSVEQSISTTSVEQSFATLMVSLLMAIINIRFVQYTHNLSLFVTFQSIQFSFVKNYQLFYSFIVN